MWPTGFSAAEICTMFPVWTSQKGKMLCHILSDCDIDQCISVESVHAQNVDSSVKKFDQLF